MASSAPPGPKPSGLKPPSKIGRPCCTTAKPGLPEAATPSKTNPSLSSEMPAVASLDTILERGPREDGPTKLSTIRQISEDLSRKRNGIESIFSEMEDTYSSDIFRTYSWERRYSNASHGSSSYDGLWDNARRLSEAGVDRRMSDTSVVLTEDTDSFIIGDHVWVGGSKPGQIAYIGETKFAPGEWAGVVLDEPVGKNDGSVAGIRYFQCEAKRGVFSRLTRLTRLPLEIGGGDTGSISGRASSKEPVSGMSTPSRRLMSPSASTRDLLKKSSSPSLSSISSATHHHSPVELKVGDRVIVMSSQGSKAGILKFIGPTEFAAGEWCGVELDDPLGKNDGSVGDKRYFECGPKFGLFAPAHKVSRSPSSRKPTTAANCAVHRSSITSATPLRRAGSRESMTSAASTASVRSSRLMKAPATPIKRSSLQDTLKEKDLYIERLLKERDLERAEVTRAASQADDAEQKLSLLQHEYDQSRDEAEAKMHDFQSLVNRLQLEKIEIARHLEDEKAKIEDLQFRIEEETILKNDIEKKTVEKDAVNTSHLDAISELERQLSAERSRCETLEQTSMRLIATEEVLAGYKADLETTRGELEEARKSMQINAQLLEKGGEEKGMEINKLRKELEEVNKSLQLQTEEAEKLGNLYKLEIEKLQKEAGDIKASLSLQVESLEKELCNERELLANTVNDNKNAADKSKAELENVLKNKEDEINAIRKELTDAQNLIALKSADLNKGEQSRMDLEAALQKEVLALKSALEEKSAAFAKESEQVVELNKQMEARKLELDNTCSSLKKTSDAFEELSKISEETSAGLKQQLETNQNLLKERTEELEKLMAAHQEDIKTKSLTIEGLEGQLKEKNSAFEAKNRELADSQEQYKNYTLENNNLLENLKSQIKEKDDQLRMSSEGLAKVNSEQQVVIENKASEIKSLGDKLTDTEAKLKLTEEDSKKIISELSTSLKEKASAIEADQILISEKESQINEIKSDIKSLKEKLESEAKLNNELHEKELETCRGTLREVESRLVEKESELRHAKNEVDKTGDVVATQELAIKKQTEETESLKAKLAAAEDSSVALSADISKLQLELGDLQRKIQSSDDKCSQLTFQKQKLEADISGLMGTSSDSSAQLTKLNAELRAKEQEVDAAKEMVTAANQETEMVKHKLKLVTEQSEKSEQDLAEKLKQLTAQKQKSDEETKTALDKAKETENQLKETIEDMADASQKCDLRHKMTIEELHQTLEKAQLEVTKAIDHGKESDTLASKKFEGFAEETRKKEEGLRKQLEDFTGKLTKTEDELQVKSDLAARTEQELRVKAEEVLEMSKIIDRIEKENVSFGTTLQDREGQLSMLKTEFEKLNEEKLANDKLLEEQNNRLALASQQLETLQNEKNNTEMSASEKDSKLVSTLGELQRLQREKETVDSALKDLQTNFAKATQDLERYQEEKIKSEKRFSEQETTANTLMQEIAAFKENVTMISTEKESIQSLLSEKTDNLSKILEELKIVTEEKESFVNLSTEKDLIVKKISQENESLKQSLEKHLQEKDGVVSSLSEKDSKLNNVLEDLSKLRSENATNEKLAAERELALAQALKEIGALKENTSKSQQDLEAKLAADTKKLELTVDSFKEKLDHEKRNSNDLQEKLAAKEGDFVKLEEQLQAMAVNSQNSTELSIQLAALQKELQNTQHREQEFKTHSEQEKTTSAKLLESTKSLLAQKEKDLQKQTSEVSSLTVEREESKKYKSMLDTLQGEKKQLERQVVELQLAVTQAKSKAVKEEPSISDDKDAMQGQIDFLNSVIVDMHRKNDELKARQELLEMGISPADADELKLNGVKPRMVAPRSFCDICDMFDVHETEDCPRQAMDSPPPAPPTATHGKPPKGPAADRPYCDNCEMFGHATEDCDDGEMF